MSENIDLSILNCEDPMSLQNDELDKWEKAWEYVWGRHFRYSKEIENFLKELGFNNPWLDYEDGRAILYMPFDKSVSSTIVLYGNHYLEGNDRIERQKFQLEHEGDFWYQIVEYEWRDNKEKIKNQIRNLFGKNQNKIMARKCEIKEVLAKDSREFLNANHLQGVDHSSVKLGLYYNNDLVSLMTFAKPRFSKNYEWELSRFCCKANTNVSGGGSKLFKHFIKNYQPTNIVSYSDMAKTRGTMYANLGFTLSHIAGANYVWSCEDIQLTRYKCQRHKLVKQFPEFEGWSETQIMTHLGYQKLEDCGNKVWVWNNPNK